MNSKFEVKVDKNFAMELLDRMINWDNSVVRRKGKQVGDEDLQVLYDAWDFFFSLVLNANLQEVDYLAPLFKDLCLRVSHKHKNLFYEGFFHALAQMLMLRKLMLSFGESAWYSQYSESFQKTLVKLNLLGGY